MRKFMAAVAVAVAALVAGPAWAVCPCVAEPCEIQQCPPEQADGWGGQVRTESGFVGLGNAFAIGHGASMTPRDDGRGNR